jgi:hypothetical protein
MTAGDRRPLRHPHRIWGRASAARRAGTGEVVQLALTRGTCIIHLAPDASLPAAC